MSLRIGKKQNEVKRSKASGVFVFGITIMMSFFLFANSKAALAIDGIMNGKTISGETDNFLLWLQTYDPTTSPYFFDKFFIDKAGNVGIGTTNPDARRLHISGLDGDMTGTGGLRIDTKQGVLGTRQTIFDIGPYTTGANGAVMKLFENGIETVRLISGSGAGNNYINSGNVGIGTTAPNDTLSIGNSGAAPAGSAKTGHNFTSTYLATDSYALVNYGLVQTLILNATSSIIAGNLWNGTLNGNIYNGTAGAGNVGIGTTNPGANLEISRTLANNDWSALTISNKGAWNTATNKYAQLAFTDGTGNVAGIGATFTGTVGRLDFNGFYNGGYGATSAVVMSILGTGNVGIGTTNPTSIIQVAKSNVGATNIFSFENTDNTSVNSNARLKIASGGTSGGNPILQLTNNTSNWYMNMDQADSNKLKIGTGISDSKLVIDSSGNVGVGTASPTAKLHIGPDGSQLLVGSVGGGRSAVVGSKITLPGSAGATNEYAAYFAYDAYYDEPSSSWLPVRNNLGGKWKMEMGYHTADMRFSYSSAFAPIAWSDLLTIKNTGNVGIGTTAPNDLFSIGNSGAAPAGSSKTGHNFTSTYLATDDYALANYGLVRTLVANATSSLVSGNLWNGTLNGNIYNGTAGAGNVGVGTTNPNAKLNVIGNAIFGATSTDLVSPGTARVLINDATFTNTRGLGFYAPDGTKNPRAWIQQVTASDGSSQYMTFDSSYSSGSTYANWNFMNGNVGIGTTSPVIKLHVFENSASTRSAIIEQAGTGDAALQYSITGFTNWITGVDNSNSDSFNISASNSIGTNDRLTILTGGNVGIGATNPAYKLDVNGFSRLGGGAAIKSTTGNWIYYPNVVSYSTSTTVVGAMIIHTNIARASAEMFKVRVIGYGYGSASNIDFIVVGYAYAGTNGNVDSVPGAVVSYSIVDNGNDGLTKRVGIDAAGNVAISVGDIDSSFYYYRLAADFWSTRSISDASTGWSIDTNTVSGFGWGDLKVLSPAITQLTSGNVGIGTSVPNDTFSIGNSGAAPAGSSKTGHNFTSTYLATDNYALANYGLVKTLIGNATSSITLWSGTKNGTIWNGDLGVGNVGIGTTTPTSKLEIVTSATPWTATKVSALGVAQALYTGQVSNLYSFIGDAFYYNATLWRSGTTFGSAIKFDNGAIRFVADSGLTANTDYTPTERLTILNGGNVGVGMANPSMKLEVAGTQGLPASSGTTQTGAMRIGYSAGNPKLDFGSVSANGASWLQATNATDLSVNYPLLLNPNGGNIGIGTTNPVAQLHVMSATSTDAAAIIKFDTPNGGSGDVQTADISFTSASNNSLDIRTNYSSVSNKITLTPGGVTTMTLLGSGNVGIGTTAPNDTLSIGNAGAAPAGSAKTGHNFTSTYLATDSYALVNYGLVQTLIGNATSSLVAGNLWNGTLNGNIYNGVAGAGNVGIGTTNPQAKFDVGYSAGQSATAGAVGLIRNAASADTSPYTQARIMVYGGAGVDATNYAYLGYGSDAALRIVYRNTTQDYPMYIGSATSYSGAGAFTPEMTIKGGNVGVGVTAPLYKLDVAGVINASSSVFSAPTGENGYRIKFRDYGGTSNDAGIGIEADNGKMWFNNVAGGGYYFGDGTNGYMFTIQGTSGNVGIGTTNPIYGKLQVNDSGTYADGIALYAGSGNLASSYLKSDGASDFNWHLTRGGSDTAGIIMKANGSVGIGTTAPNDTFSIGNAGAAPAGSAATGHNFTSTYLATDSYALVNYGLVQTLIGNATSSLVSGNLWNGTLNGSIYNGTAGAGNVGVGTTTPGYKLEINGTFKTTASSSSIMLDANGNISIGI